MFGKNQTGWHINGKFISIYECYVSIYTQGEEWRGLGTDNIVWDEPISKAKRLENVENRLENLATKNISIVISMTKGKSTMKTATYHMPTRLHAHNIYSFQPASHEWRAIAELDFRHYVLQTRTDADGP